VALLEAGTMVFQLIWWVDLCRSLSTWRILKNMMLLLLQTDRFLNLQFADNSSQGSKTPPIPRSAACKKPGMDGKPPQKSSCSSALSNFSLVGVDDGLKYKETTSSLKNYLTNDGFLLVCSNFCSCAPPIYKWDKSILVRFYF